MRCSPGLDAFLAEIRADESLQLRLRSITTMAELIELARERGHALNRLELQLWVHSPWFDAPYWPWADQDPAGRASFFRGP